VHRVAEVGNAVVYILSWSFMSESLDRWVRGTRYEV